jgi:hypothetical protein
MRYYRSLSVAFAMILPVGACATSIVAIWTEKQITIAADSTQTRIDQLGNIVGSRQGCKIFQVRGLVFALSGLAQTELLSVTDEIKSGKEFTERGSGKKLPIESIVVAAHAALVKTLQARSSTRDDKMPIDLVIAGMIDGKLQMVHETTNGMQIQGDYSIPMSSRHITYPQDRGYNGSDPNRGIETPGLEDVIDRFKRILPKEWNKGSDVELARRLVAIEASDALDARYVGEPISTIIINKKGMQWIDKGTCDWNVPTSKKQ